MSALGPPSPLFGSSACPGVPGGESGVGVAVRDGGERTSTKSGVEAGGGLAERMRECSESGGCGRCAIECDDGEGETVRDGGERAGVEEREGGCELTPFGAELEKGSCTMLARAAETQSCDRERRQELKMEQCRVL